MSILTPIYYANTAFLNPLEKQAVFNIWNKEYPKNLIYSEMEEFDSYLLGLENPHHILAKDERNQILGWFVDFKRENDIWFAMILDTSIQGSGIGTKILNKVKNLNKVLNGWVIDQETYLKKDGSTYRSPKDFYLKNNFKLIAKTRLELPKISAVKIIWTAD